MRISDWSSDVCSSDLNGEDQGMPVLGRRMPSAESQAGNAERDDGNACEFARRQRLHENKPGDQRHQQRPKPARDRIDLAEIAVTIEIGRASCRERVCQYV